jgi:hypothetical protein
LGIKKTEIYWFAMLDTDQLVIQRSEYDTNGPRNSRDLANNIRHNNKVVLEATNQSVNFTSQRSRMSSSFESLFRAVGLGVGVVAGGPVGGATLSSIAGGVGRGVGDFLGNRIYGKTIYELDKIITDNKYKQLINNYAYSKVSANIKLVDEFYKQSSDDTNEVVRDLAQ